MQIVTDSGTDVGLSAQELAELRIHVVPLVVTLAGKTYREGLDIEASEFFRLLEETGSLPTTSQPSAGDFAELYRKLAKDDPDILSIHMSSGLSGTFSSASAAAQMVPEAKVTCVDTKTLSVASGWQVKAAARAVQAGWPLERVLDLVARVSQAANTMFTLQELKYLIHGGRISHMKGLLAMALKIRPVIAVEKVRGTYANVAQARAIRGAAAKLVKLVGREHPPGTRLRAQIAQAQNPEGGAMLRALVDEQYECDWLPAGDVSLVLGAHTGPSLIGLAYAAADAFEELDAL